MKCDAFKSEMTAWRHDFHRHPELGFQEERTAEIVVGLLKSFGLEVHEKVGGTGVVGVLQRGNGTGSVAFRADMDALPLCETGDCAHKSTNNGVMHACGHDGHTSMLLGAAKYLAEVGNFDGRVIFIFQPNEENGLGAKAMIDDGRSGSIITISSQMAMVGGVDRAVYCGSKHAVEGFTKAMAVEFGRHGVRVNTICPTFIRTPFTEQTFSRPDRVRWIEEKIKLGRVGEIEDIMGAVQFLASDAAALVTGTALVVDGGWTAE